MYIPIWLIVLSVMVFVVLILFVHWVIGHMLRDKLDIDQSDHSYHIIRYHLGALVHVCLENDISDIIVQQALDIYNASKDSNESIL